MARGAAQEEKHEHDTYWHVDTDSRYTAYRGSRRRVWFVLLLKRLAMLVAVYSRTYGV